MNHWDERFLQLVKRCKYNHRNSIKNYQYAFIATWQSFDINTYRRGNNYRFMMTTDGQAYTWKKKSVVIDDEYPFTWKRASPRIERLLRMVLFPEVVFDVA